LLVDIILIPLSGISILTIILTLTKEECMKVPERTDRPVPIGKLGELDVLATRVNQRGSPDVNGEFFDVWIGSKQVLVCSPAPFRDLKKTFGERGIFLNTPAL
jgi:hypothetical protein